MAVFSSYSCDNTPLAAVVGTEKITLAEFNGLCQNRAQLLNVASLSREEKRKVLEVLVQRELVYLHAVKNKLTISEAEFEQAAKLRSFAGLSKADREKKLLFDKVRRSVTGNVSATRPEIEGYYQAHKKEYSLPERYRVYLVKVSEAEATHVLKNLKKNPAAFDDMALKRGTSDLQEVNQQAPYTPLDQFPEEMAPALRTMKIGEIAGPVAVKKGTYLFKLIGRQKASAKNLVDVYAELSHLLSAEKQDAAFGRWYDTIKGSYNVEIRVKDLVSIQ